MKNTVFWMWHCVVLVCTEVSEERIAIFRVKILEQGTSVSRWLQTDSPIENTELHIV
jgi:hypothetical protein